MNCRTGCIRLASLQCTVEQLASETGNWFSEQQLSSSAAPAQTDKSDTDTAQTDNSETDNSETESSETDSIGTDNIEIGSRQTDSSEQTAVNR